jgi:hypothetical protein
MNRVPFVGLVGLLVLIGVGAPHMAAAQGYGPTPRIIGVTSGRSPYQSETIQAGQTRTLPDHRGPTLMVRVWIPGSYASGEHRLLFVYNNGYIEWLRQAQPVPVYDAGWAIGTVWTYSMYHDFFAGICTYVQAKPSTGFGSTEQEWHQLVIR